MEDRGAWHALVHGVTNHQTWLTDWATKIVQSHTRPVCSSGNAALWRVFPLPNAKTGTFDFHILDEVGLTGKKHPYVSIFTLRSTLQYLSSSSFDIQFLFCTRKSVNGHVGSLRRNKNYGINIVLKETKNIKRKISSFFFKQRVHLIFI